MSSVEARYRSARPIAENERSAFYAEEYASHADHAFLSGYLTAPIRSVLDIPCGPGRNCEWLLRTGKQITFVDASAHMVRLAHRRCKLAVRRPRAQVVQADLRTLDLGCQFDLILVPDAGLQVLGSRSDVSAALRRLRCHLVHDGLVVVDLRRFPCTCGDTAACIRHIDGFAFEQTFAAPTLHAQIVRRVRHHVTSTRVVLDYLYEVTEASSGTKHLRTTISLLNLSRRFVTAVANDAGFVVNNTFGDYMRQPYTRRSPRLILELKLEQS